MKKLMIKLKWIYLRWVVKHFGVCAYGHKADGVIEAGCTNCVYGCDRCGKTWAAYYY